MSGANLRLFLALAEAERRADDWEYTAKDCVAQRADRAETRIREADAFLADPAGNPLDAINLARGALSGASEEGEE